MPHGDNKNSKAMRSLSEPMAFLPFVDYLQKHMRWQLKVGRLEVCLAVGCGVLHVCGLAV